MPPLQLLRPLLLMTLLLAACAAEPVLPTTVPLAELPAAAPDETPPSLPPTRDLWQTATPMSMTPTPTRQPTPTATPVVAPILNITTPGVGEQVALGQELDVSGFGHSGAGLAVQLALVSAMGETLAEGEATAAESTWAGTLQVPTHISGSARVEALVVDDVGAVRSRDSVPVVLALPDEASEPEQFLTLDRPTMNGVAVAGHALFFDGRLQRPGGGLVKLTVRTEDCQNVVGGYDLNLRSSTYWYSYVYVPSDVSGPACAVATIGTPGDEGWLEAHHAITILPVDDEAATDVMIAHPGPGWLVRAGEEMTVRGVAFNAPDDRVRVNVTLSGGRIVADTFAEADSFGYWELPVMLPVNAADEEINITATIAEGQSASASAWRIVSVIPAASSP